MSEEMNLKRSKEVVGHLYPVLLDAKGNVIDGFHRRDADPDWPAIRLEWVKDEETRELVRAHANLQRRVASAEEHKQSFLKLAQKLMEKGVKRGKIVTEIAKVTGFTDRCVRELLPDKFKAVEHAAEPERVPVEEIRVSIPKTKVEQLRKLGELRDVVPKAIDWGVSALEREAQRGRGAKESEPEPAPEPKYTGEDWECPICEALYRLFHLSEKEHKFDLAREGKSADNQTTRDA